MRKSIITNYMEYSIFSGRPTEAVHHCLFGKYGSLRNFAEKNDIVIPLTDSEHNMSSKGTINQIHGNPIAEKLSKFLGQMAWEKRQLAIQLSEVTGKSVEEIDKEVREKFRKETGESFL